MISEEYGKFVLVCDVCEHSVSFDTWGEAVDYAIDSGWIRCKGSDIEDICPNCTGDADS